MKGASVILDENYRMNPVIVHYYKEIIRHWNKLNFIIKKTQRSLNQNELSNSYEIALLLYTTYRFIFEKASIKAIKEEINLTPKLYSYLNQLNTFSWSKALNGKTEVEKLSIDEAIPTFVIEHLLPVMKIDFLKDNISFMNRVNEYKNITIRINNLQVEKADFDLKSSIRKTFQKLGISFYQDKHIPIIFHTPLRNKKKILQNKWYKNGRLIFQDKASVAVIQLLSPQPNEFIFDMCAAPGIKTSLIAQYSNNQACIISNDFNKARLTQAIKIFSKLYVSNVFLINADGIKFPIRSKNLFDKILIDAPCTGSGTFSTNPELKWRQNERFLHQNVVLQEKLLKSALKLLKPSGILVYSTCSLYPEEGEMQVLKILDNFEPMELPKWFSPSYKVKNQQISGTGRLFPAIHQTKGFFIGKFKKK